MLKIARDVIDLGLPNPSAMSGLVSPAGRSLSIDASLNDTKRRYPPSTQFTALQDSPSQRSGPPRSLSFAYSLSTAASGARNDSIIDEEDVLSPDVHSGYSFASPISDFRGALEYVGSEPTDRKGKRRESRGEGWSPKIWFQESPKNERTGFDFGDLQAEPGSSDQRDASGGAGRSKAIKQSKSTSTDDRSVGAVLPSPSRGNSAPNTPTGHTKWHRLRLLLPHILPHDRSTSTQDRSVVVSNQVDITDELVVGGLSTLMLRLWFERDEKGHRRVPVFLDHLRIRVSDSLHPMHRSKAVFRIECEYANGAARLVVYKQLRDFISLHTHYTVSNIHHRNVDNLPEFPRTSMPTNYCCLQSHKLPLRPPIFQVLEKRRAGHRPSRLCAPPACIVGELFTGTNSHSRTSNSFFCLISDETILLQMFHPSANRVAAFLEVSALFISLARSGGAQYKAGILHIESSSGTSGSGFGRKSIGWRARKEPKWCALRESYLVVLEEPGEVLLQFVSYSSLTWTVPLSSKSGTFSF